MRNISLKDLKNYKKIFLVNSSHILKKKKFIKDSCYIYTNNVKDENLNSFVFSFSEFKNGYLKRCQVSKMAFKYSLKLEKNIKNKNPLIFKFLELKFSKNFLSLLLKKFLLENIYEYFYLLSSAKELRKKNYNIEIINFSQKIFFFENYLNLFKKNKFLFKKKFLFKNFLNYLKFFVSIFTYQIFSILFTSKISFQKKKIKYAVRFYNYGFNLDTTPKINWVFSNVSKKDYCLICEQSPEKDFIKKFRKNNINFKVICNKNPIQNINFLCLPKYLFNSFVYFFLSIFALFKSELLINFIQKLIVSSIKWEKFIDTTNVDKYVSYHNYDFDHIVRNFYLKKTKTETFHYKHTFAENIYENELNYNNHNYGFINYDNEFHWSSISKKMSILDKSQSKNYIINGPISSQYFKKNKKKNKRIICFFSTQLGSRDSVCCEENHIKFLDYVKNFANKKKYKIILKPKYKLKEIKNTYPEVYKKIISLKKNRSIKIVEYLQAEKFMFDSWKIVSMPFASTTVQGIYANIPSYYLDLNKQFNNIFYKKNKIYFTNAKDMDKALILKNTNLSKIKNNIFKENYFNKRIPDFFKL